MNDIKKEWFTYNNYEINLKELLYFKINSFNKVIFVFNNGERIKTNFDFNNLVELKMRLRE